MFDNIGRKVKFLAYFTFVLGCILSVIRMIQFWQGDLQDSPGIGFLILIVGVIFSWIGSWVIYAIGQIAEDTDHIARKINSESASYGKHGNYGYIDKLKGIDDVISKSAVDMSDLIDKTDPLTAEVTRFKTNPVTGEVTHLYDE